MKRMNYRTIQHIAMAGLVTIAGATLASIPAMALNQQFEETWQNKLNALNERFDEAHRENLNALNERFDEAHQENLNS